MNQIGAYYNCNKYLRLVHNINIIIKKEPQGMLLLILVAGFISP